MNDDTVGGLPLPEHLDIAGGTPLRDARPRGRRTVVAALTVLGVITAGGAAVWAWQAWVAQGPQPSEALPASTLAYVAIDLDPPGRQKVEALGVLKSFPSLEKQLGLDTDDDIRRSAFEELASEGSCTLDYADDVEPWIGDRAAVAVVDQDEPEPVVVLQVKDADRAKQGLDSITDCVRESGPDSGWVIEGNWAVLARSEAVARTVVEDAAGGTLADDPEFQELTGDAGEPGVITLYAAPEAGPALVEAIEHEPSAYFLALPLMSGLDPLGTMVGPFLGLGLVGSVEGPIEDAEAVPMPEPTKAEKELWAKFEHFDDLTKAEQEALLAEQEKLYEQQMEELEFEDFPEPELPAPFRESLMEFSGLGGVVRFQAGGVELEMVSDRLEGRLANITDGEAGDDAMSELPDDTAIAFGAGLADDWVDRMVAHLLSGEFAFPRTSQAELIADFERETGLDVPGDVEDLAGDSAALALGAGFDPDAMYRAPEQLPVAARITGDPDKVEAALAKLRGALSPSDAKLLLSRRVGDGVLVSGNAEYLDRLAEGGDLAGTGRFRDVVPDAGDATSVFFVNFDAGDWLVNAMGDDEERADMEPLEALGYTTWADGDRERLLVRLSLED